MSVWLPQAVDWQWTRQTRPLSSASWALLPPNSLRYQSIKQSVLSHPFHHASQPQAGGPDEEDWESPGPCVLVRQSEAAGLHTLLEILLMGHNKVGELLTPGPHKSAEFSFRLTTVDGRREDDISVDGFKREHGCFRSLFEAERCPAPFMYGSQFYCFHCPATQPVAGSWLECRLETEHDSTLLEFPLLPPTSLCSHAEGGRAERHSEEEEKLAMMYERLRTEVRVAKPTAVTSTHPV